MGLSTSLNTAVSGLNATQIGIGIVSQNVANAGTAGYVRRAVSTVDNLSGQTVGVQNTQVQRLLDKIVQHQLWQESAGAAYTQKRADMLSSVDKLYGAPGSTTALDSIYSGFTSALQALQNDPSSYSLRTAVLDSANLLANRLNTLSDGVQALRTEAESGIATGVNQVNDLLNALTSVNARIVGQPNDPASAELKDRRDLILSELSQYIDIKTSEDARGSISIVTGSGTQIFDGRPAVTFGFDAKSGLDADDQWSSDPALRGVGTITMTNSSGGVMDAIANKTFRSGEIAALIEMRDKTLVQAQSQLDEIASQMAKALSQREIPGTAATLSGQNGLQVTPGALSYGDSLNLQYRTSGASATQRLSFVSVGPGTTLPVSAQGDASNRAVAIDFSAPDADILTAVTAALPVGFTADVTGGVITIAADGTGGRAVNALTASVSPSSATDPAGTLPVFVDGSAGTVFSGSYEGGSQSTGFAARIKLNSAIVDNRALLLGPSGTAAGDSTRPKFLLDQLTAQRSVTNTVSLNGSTASSVLSVSNLVQRVVSSQGQAVETAQRLNEGQQVALAAIQSRFQETAQVNVDQEMAQLIELQTAYAANARIISTVKEMMDVLMRV